ncbi:MAG TPA: hypothetical protein VN752_09645 [Solirubrobacterales bacterium]|nr:hypothetical protein [Solirubrobacterales bacterium]
MGKLQVAVLEACQRERVWPAKVAAAVSAAVEFAIAEPELARLLTIESLIRQPDGGQRHVRMLEHFAELLRVDAPQDRRRPKSTEQALVGGVGKTLADHLRCGDAAAMRRSVPELVELLLVPYVGRSEARRWAARSAAQIEGRED